MNEPIMIGRQRLLSEVLRFHQQLLQLLQHQLLLFLLSAWQQTLHALEYQ